jgi:hypothetical protein
MLKNTKLLLKSVDEVDWNGKNWATSCTFSEFSKHGSIKLEIIDTDQVLSNLKVGSFYIIEQNYFSFIK